MAPSFSQRKGIVPLKKELQVDSMDDDLRNGIWNVLLQWTLSFSPSQLFAYTHDTELDKFFKNLWMYYFKNRIDDLPSGHGIIPFVKGKFFSVGYNEVYDLLEYFTKNYPFNDGSKESFVKELNSCLEREFCAYRLVNNEITEITSTEEIAEIEEATQTPLSSVNQHMEKALSHLSNRENPDYANSIKESISAVESLCKKITGNDDATMGNALNEIETQGTIELHSDMKEAFKKLYHYTSDSGGIRHGLMEGDTPPDFDDAKFMLVACSAIVNYLISKANKAGISLS